jgi:hypothetical protein
MGAMLMSTFESFTTYVNGDPEVPAPPVPVLVIAGSVIELMVQAVISQVKALVTSAAGVPQFVSRAFTLSVPVKASNP